VSDLRVFWHDDCLRHDTGAGLLSAGPSALLARPEPHPESATRLENMRSALERGPLAPRLDWHDGRHAQEGELHAVHPPAYVEAMRAACRAGTPPAANSPVGPETWPAALAAAGTALAACDAALAGGSPTLALVRPPGHHAGPARADGFCLFNAAALCAERARAAGRRRVAVLDLDVHHGNGTQACFWERDDVLTISVHLDHRSWGPSHPEDGLPAEVGAGDGQGANVNVALPPGVGDEGHLAVLDRVVAPLVAQARCDALVVALGEDASAFDPVGRMTVTTPGFRGLGERVGALVDGPLVLVQEGGYAPTYAAVCLHAFCEGLVGAGELTAEPLAYVPDRPGLADAAIVATAAALAPWWQLGVPAAHQA
jgi:acetoin utilization deacetylase AcuC-like enzyme